MQTETQLFVRINKSALHKRHGSQNSGKINVTCCKNYNSKSEKQLTTHLLRHVESL